MDTGERLLQRILAEVFPALIQGLGEKRFQYSNGEKDGRGGAALENLRRDSLDALYRLLLLFYAESRGLPPTEGPRSRAILLQVKEEIAQQAGTDPRKAADRLARAYSATACTLHDRLLPGMQPEVVPPDLLPRKLRNLPLALAIDGLARAAADGTGELQFVDYAELEVRLLGSIHEALLERKPEIRDGKVCLVQDKANRKSGGCYYTPAPIVKHIVEHTVGPVLARKLALLRPEFQETCQGTEGRAAADPRHLFEKLFDFRVLDPAMGSGHFLVEAARFITGRLAQFLKPFAIHPALGRRDRLARRVLEDCIHGVDLDPMAVELARMSLWLDAAVPELPFSRFGAHLRCGNSLVAGNWLDEKAGAFDCVIGNPPYLGVRTGLLDPTFVEYAARRYRSAKRNWDLAALFIESGLERLKPEGSLGMIVPTRLCANRDFALLRDMVFDLGGPAEVIDCGAAFDDPTVLATILIVSTPPRDACVRLGCRAAHGLTAEGAMPRDVLRQLPDRPFTTPLRLEHMPTFLKLSNAPLRLGTIATITRGMECGKNDPHVMPLPSPGLRPVISGEGVGEFAVRSQGLYMPDDLQPASKYKPRLFASVPRLLVRFVAPWPIAAVDGMGFLNFNTVYNVVLQSGGPDEYAILACLLNSHALRWWFTSAFNSRESVFPHIQKYQLAEVPLPNFDLDRDVMRRLAALGHVAVKGEAFDRQELDRLALEACGMAEVPRLERPSSEG